LRQPRWNELGSIVRIGFLTVGVWLAIAARAAIVWGQPSIQYPRTPSATSPSIPSTIAPSTPGWNAAATPPSLTAPSISIPGSPTVGAAPFDPYSSSGAAAHQYWATPGASTPVTPMPGSPLVPQNPAPYTAPGNVPYGSPYGQPVTPASPQQPGVMFPNGIQSPQYDWNNSLRLIQDVRLRQTYVFGDDEPLDLAINDTEVALTFTWPNFLTTNQPLFISPAFALNLWDGPRDVAADLPPSAYSAYLDFQYQTDPQYQIGAELGVRVGAYTDFNTFTTDSIRVQGLALAVGRLTPTLTLKLGVIYLDRNDIKILPAGGIVWQPSPQVRWDIFFPQPKLAQYLSTVGTHEVWWYIAGEYGGGAWTIKRTDDTTDRVDINDIRVSLGLEFTGPRNFTGFGEIGYVFQRELYYVNNPQDNTDLNDSFMVRAGFSW
jgi:hypothetical protein